MWLVAPFRSELVEAGLSVCPQHRVVLAQGSGTAKCISPSPLLPPNLLPPSLREIINLKLSIWYLAPVVLLALFITRGLWGWVTAARSEVMAGIFLPISATSSHGHFHLRNFNSCCFPLTYQHSSSSGR